MAARDRSERNRSLVRGWANSSDGLGGGGPDAGWFGDAGPQLPREDLRRIADAYFTGLERNDGKGDYPFAD